MVGIICQLGRLNFVLNLLPTLWNLYFKHRCKKECFQVVVKKASCPNALKEKEKLIKKLQTYWFTSDIWKSFWENTFQRSIQLLSQRSIFQKMPLWIFTQWFLHLTVATYCSRYQFFFWLWFNYWCQRFILRYFKAFW